jgi:plasmid stabilization system protein ParE
VRIELSDEADAQITEIDAWWRENRLAAPDLFTDELERALADLGATPTLGTVYRAGPATVRRLLLHRSQYHVYFIRAPKRVSVLAVWSCYRGRGPRL